MTATSLQLETDVLVLDSKGLRATGLNRCFTPGAVCRQDPDSTSTVLTMRKFNSESRGSSLMLQGTDLEFIDIQVSDVSFRKRRNSFS
jgi:hypothetical protein